MINLLFAIAALTSRVERDAYCLIDNVPVGVVVAGTEVEVLEQTETQSLVYSPKHKVECWLPNTAFDKPSYIHPDHLRDVMRWETIVNRWLYQFPNLSAELVLSVIYKETAGNPHAVDQTGNDVRLVGAASVGLMAAIPRPHLPCYETLTGPNGKDEYSCQLFLGMFILNSAIQQAHDLRVDTPSTALKGTVTGDAECSTFVYDGSPVGWARKGERVEVLGSARDGSGAVSHVKIASSRFGRPCWIPVAKIDQDDAPPAIAPVDVVILPEDVEMGLWLYGCSLENVLADNCLVWGRDAYSELVLETILPEIRAALEKGNQ